jgi:protein-S-isoprenylcysteine O-methyltransferase Ste14
MRTLERRTFLNTAKFLCVVGLILFGSAGTFRFWQAWLYLALHLAWLTLVGCYFLKKDPSLVERRLTQDEQGEKEKSQRTVMAVVRALGVVTLAVAGFDRRLQWSAVPITAVVAGGVLFVAGIALVFAVFAENTYTSSIIEVDDGQVVVTTGPYRVVRHPMYTGTVLMGLATPLLLGSYWAALLIPPGWAMLVFRILAEERFLFRRLPGYAAYLDRTRSRLIPGLW